VSGWVGVGVPGDVEGAGLSGVGLGVAPLEGAGDVDGAVAVVLEVECV
jgi:hypothetical protein